MNTLSATERAELAAHRVWHGELAPWVDAITADLASERVTLHVCHPSVSSGWQGEFEQTIESGWDQVFSSSELVPAPGLELRFHTAEAFTTPEADSCLLYVSPWSSPAA